MARQSNSTSARTACGNTLLLFLCIIVVLTIVAGLGFTFYSGFFALQKLTQRAELLSMYAARCLNPHDRAGQITDMLAASRELVFNSEATYNNVAANQSEIEPLAKKLSDESREGARLVAIERDRIADMTVQDVRDLTKSFNDDQNKKDAFVLPWASLGKMTIRDVKLGYVSAVESCAPAPIGNPSLMAVDQSQINSVSQLYKGNSTLTLPAPDSNLKFKLSSLPAPANGTIAPLRFVDNGSFQTTLPLLTNGAFEHGECEQIPSAVQLTLIGSFENSLLARTEQTMAATATAAANGASPRP